MPTFEPAWFDPAASAGKVLYLFCFARAGASPDFGTSRDVFEFSRGELMAVCRWDSVDEWSGPPAEQRMADLQWLGVRAMRHQAVIEAVMRRSPVLPARLGTLFSSARALDRFILGHRGTIAAFLSELENKEEWALKVYLDRARATRWLISRASALPAERVAGGAGYLHERRALIAASKETHRWAAQALEPLVEQLRRCAARSYQRHPAAPDAADQPQAILNLAFLVPRENLEDFRGHVESARLEHSGHGLELSMSGPWPPYSFCPTLEMPPP